MKIHKFYNDQIHDLIALKKIPDIFKFYDNINSLLENGDVVRIYVSSIEPDSNHFIEFKNTEEFLIWRKHKESEINNLLDLFKK